MIPIVTPEEMAAVDAAAPEPVEVLIGRAGGALARAALAMLGGAYGCRVVVIAGKGNNGNDGRDAAVRLGRRGVRVAMVDAGALPELLPECDLVIDAGYGTGFTGEFAPPTTEAPVLACDIPSGVDGRTGQVGGDAYRAERTITFAALKPGLVLEPGAAHAGSIEVADIGLDTTGARAHLVEAGDVARLVPGRSRTDHKWRSACWVVGGSPGMAGAPTMAAAAAMRAGAGYARLSIPGATDPTVPAWAPEVVTTPLPADDWGAQVLADTDRLGALVIGPGLGREAGAAVQARAVVAEATLPVVVDGDGLRAVDPSGPITPAGAAPRVLTPHDGEYEALAGEPPGPDRFAAARSLAERLGSVVLLKGPCTVVADPGGAALAVTEGDARLATAGSGDVLSGIIGALLARGTPPLDAAAAGAFIHARTAVLGWRHGVVATDLIDHLPLALDDLLE